MHAPPVLDGMRLWQVGVLLGHHVAGPSEADEAEAADIMAARTRRVLEVEEQRRG